MDSKVFDFLNGLNVNEHTEKKNVSGKELTYLSWPWAWAEVKKRFPDASYTIWKNEAGLPYTVDPMTGFMVYTSVTIEGVTHEMWLPVMDGANRAMKPVEYDYKVKNPNFKYASWNEDKKGYYDRYGNEQPEFQIKHCDAATMMDINKTIMRCLVKNLAMFGLGLYIYAGEDLPETEDKAPEPPKEAVPPKAETTTSQKVPQKAPLSEEMKFLSNELSFIAQEKKTSMESMKATFEVCRKVAVKQKLVPDKKVTEYTMDEIKAALEYMKKSMEGAA